MRTQISSFCFRNLQKLSQAPPGHLVTWPFMQASPSTSGTKTKILIHGRKITTKRIRFAPIHYSELRCTVSPKFAKVSSGTTWQPGDLATWPPDQPEQFRHQIQDFNLWAQNYYKTYQVCAHPLLRAQMSSVSEICKSIIRHHMATWRPRHMASRPTRARQAPKSRF